MLRFILLFLLVLMPLKSEAYNSPLLFNGSYSKFLTNQWRLLSGEEYDHLTVDPSAGAGFAAPIGSVGVRNNAGAGELWFKIGAGNAAWANALTSSSGWSLLGNAGTSSAANFVGTTDANDLVLKRNSAEKLRLISSGIQAANIYGDTAASGNLLLDSTTNATKGNVNLGQSYKEFSTGRITVGDITATPGVNQDIYYKAKGGSGRFIMSSSGGQEWIFQPTNGMMQINIASNAHTGIALDTANRFSIGDKTAQWMASLSSIGDNGTTIGTFQANGSFITPVVEVQNSNNTNNNFEGVLFENSANGWGSGLFGVNENHNAVGTATGHLEAWTNNAGTRARAVKIAADKTITMDKYGAGAAQFDASGVISSTAPGASGNLFTSNGSAWLSQAPVNVVNSGVAGRLALYPATGTAVDDQYTQNANLIDVEIASHATLAATRKYTVPDSGADANFVMTEGAQTINGAKTLGSQLDMSSHKIINVTDPTAAQDAATKNYVDTQLSAFQPKEATQEATAAALPANVYVNGVAGVGATLTGSVNGALVVDGVTVAVGDRVLVKDEVTASHNGIYDVTATGSVIAVYVLTRSADYNTAADIDAGDLIPVISGTVNAVTSWLQTNAVTTVGTDALSFTKYSSNPANIAYTNANNLFTADQYLGAKSLDTRITNDTVTGTTVNKLAKLSGAPSKAIISATADTSGIVGIVLNGAGTAGSADIAQSGQASCVFDGATTAGHYVQNSSTTAGECHDAGASYPTSGQVLGRVLSTNGAGGTFAMVLFGPEIQGATAGGAGSTVQKARFTCGQGTGDANTKVLLNMDSPIGGTSPIYDYGTLGTAAWSAGAGPTIAAGSAEFGAAGGSFPNTGSIDSPSDVTSWIGSGDFTVDFWARSTAWSGAAEYTLFANGNGTGSIELQYNRATQKFQFISNNAIVLTTALTVVSNNTWHHIALVKSSGTTSIYLDGTSAGSAADSNNYNSSVALNIGSGLGVHFNGDIDEFRMSNTARWVANFTPPVAAYAITNTISVNPSSWITSVDGAGAPGYCTVNFAGGTFASEPVCTANIVNATVGENSVRFTGNNTTSAATLSTRFNGSEDNSSVYLMCQ